MHWVAVMQRLIRWLLRRGQTAGAPARKPALQHPRKLTREDLLRMIEENGGPEGLDLSRQDLSWLDVSREVISREAEIATQDRGRRPVWQNERNGGINLKGVNLVDANLFGANLAYADLNNAQLDGAMLKAACLAKSWLRHATLHHADLSRADLSGARAMDVDFQEADLASTDLTGTDFDGANLRGASVYKAFFSGTKISRRELGAAIMQENLADLSAFLLRHNPHYRLDTLATRFRGRQFEEARQVYSSLKANFLETGNFEDASWAHIKERQMAKITHHPRHAKDYYTDEFPQVRAWLSSKWWGFYLRHTAKWFLDCAAELTCGYGERPLRTVAWAGVILLTFPFLYACSRGVVAESGNTSWLDYFNYSLGAFTTVGFAEFDAVTPLAQTLTSLQALLGICTLALLMFALGNRISRS